MIRNIRRIVSVVLASILVFACVVSTNNLVTYAAGGITIVTQPQNVMVASGQATSIKVVASGDNLTYKWYFKKAGTSSFSVFSGQNSNVLRATANDSWDGMQVYCKVSNGVDSVDSSIVTVTLGDGIDIVRQPQDVTVSVGQVASLRVVATGNNLTYKWYFKKAGESAFSVFVGQTSELLRATSNPTWDGMQVYCKISNANTSINSDIITITLGEGIEITRQPQDVVVAVNQATSIRVVANGDNLTYKWYYKKAGDSSYSVFVGQNSNMLRATANATWDGMEVYCEISNGSTSIASDVVTITLGEGIEITRQPQDIVVAENQVATIKVVADGDNLTYKWYYKKAGASGFSLFSGQNTNMLRATSNASWDGMQVYCEISNGSTMVSSDIVTITIGDGIEIVSQPQNVTVAVGKAASIKVVANGDNLTYKWYYKKAGASSFSLFSGQNSSMLRAAANDTWDGMQVYCEISNGSTMIASDIVTITLGAGIEIISQPSSCTVAVGQATAIKVVADGDNLTYKWYFKKAGTNAYSLFSGQNTNTLRAAANATWDGMQVYCEISNGSTVVSSDVVTITIGTAIEITQQPQNAGAVVGKALSMTVVADGDNLTYKWYFKKAGSSSFSVFSGQNTSTLNATANATWDGMQVYCQIGNGSMTIDSDVATITIVDELLISACTVTGEGVNETTFYAGKQLVGTITASGTGTLAYQWQYKNADSSEWVNAGANATLNIGAASLSMQGRTYRCIVSDAYGQVATSKEITINVRTALAITTEPTSTLTFTSASESKTLTVAATGDGITYQWQVKKAGSSSYTNCTNGTNYANATTATLTIKSQAAANNGDKYRCVVKDKYSQTKESKECTISCQFVINAAWSTGLVTTIEQGKEVSVTVQQPASGITVKFYLDGTLTSSNITNGIKFTATKAAGSKHVVKAEFSGNGYATKTITYEVTVKEAVVAAIEMGDSSDYTDTVSITLSNAGEYTINFNVYAGGKKVATLNGGNITVIPRVENGTEIIGMPGVYSQGTTQTMYVKVTGVTGYEVRAELVTVVAGQKTSDMEAVDEVVEDTELDAEEVVEEQVESEDEDTEEVIEEVSEDSEVTEEVTETVEEEVPAENAVEEIVEETVEAEVA